MARNETSDDKQHVRRRPVLYAEFAAGTQENEANSCKKSSFAARGCVTAMHSTRRPTALFTLLAVPVSELSGL